MVLWCARKSLSWGRLAWLFWATGSGDSPREGETRLSLTNPGGALECIGRQVLPPPSSGEEGWRLVMGQKVPQSGLFGLRVPRNVGHVPPPPKGSDRTPGDAPAPCCPPP